MPQLVWRGVYELLGARVAGPEWSFMNYGYAPNEADGSEVALDPEDEPDRLCIQLYRRAIGRTDLHGLDVLEVGCGRGGGSSYIARRLAPRTMTGLDFSASAIALCTRHRTMPGLHFVHSDAQRMPFADNTFDAVVNIESSHCYSSIDEFLSEVHRVLRPGGRFLWADLRNAQRIDRLRQAFAASGLAMEHEEDITEGVLRSLHLDNERKLTLIATWFPRTFHGALRPFAGIEGTKNHTGLQNGDIRYLTVRFVKPPR